jgi:hypothetical protein
MPLRLSCQQRGVVQAAPSAAEVPFAVQSGGLARGRQRPYLFADQQSAESYSRWGARLSL